MSRQIEILTEAKIKALGARPGLYPDGRGLYLQVRSDVARSWIFRFTLNGKTREMGLGSLARISLVQARSAAAEKRILLGKGVDPIEHQRASEVPEVTAVGRTFETAAEEYMADKLKLLKSETHRRQWRYTLEQFAYPIIGSKLVDLVDTADVLAVLRPIWSTKCETAGRLRGRIERILARETVEGRRHGSNPAAWRGHLVEALPKRSEVQPVVHHPAMDFEKLPSFMAELSRRPEVGAAALRFLIFTAARTGEVTGARWPEIDMAARTWTVPPERAKTGREHVVPLSTAAVAELHSMEGLKDLAGGFIFPGQKGKGLSQMTLLALLQRRMEQDVTVHGFRSTFRDWAGDVGDIPQELAEAALAHVVGDSTERAYRRRTAVERRRKVMQSWSDFCLSAEQKDKPHIVSDKDKMDAA